MTDLHMPGSRAVVIGASTFLSDELLNVPAVMDTVSDLRQSLIDRCGLARDCVRFMLDWPDAHSVGAALAREAERTEGILVVYYAGHGLIGRSGELYLSMGETNPAPGQMEYTALSYGAICRHLADSPAYAIVVILDCCFSSRALSVDGSADRGLTTLAGIDGGLVLTSAAREEHALVREGEKYTAFTGHLLTLLAEGDPDGPPELTLRDVYRYLEQRLSSQGLPSPRRLSAANADDIVLAVNPARERSPAAHAPGGREPASAANAGSASPTASSPWGHQLVAGATQSYLRWLTEVNGQIPVAGLALSRGALSVPLDRVYTALRLDQSSQAERAAAAENLWRELERELLTSDLSQQEEDDLRWILYADLPGADYLGATGLLADARPEAGRMLHVGEVYQRDVAMVVLGDPGSGKTTIIRWLTLVHARALLLGRDEVTVDQAQIDAAAEVNGEFVLGRPMLPVQVRVAEYAADRQQRRLRGEQPRSLGEFLGHHSWNQRYPVWGEDGAGYHRGERIRPELLTHILGNALREKRALVVLDGLDEVPAQERTAVADAITEFITRWVPPRMRANESNKVIVTSRIAGYQLAPLPTDLTQVTIEKMTDAALRVFVHSWLHAVLAGLARESNADASRLKADDGEATALAAELTALLDLPGNRYIRDLATNPMLAAVIVSIFINQGNALPSQRVEVYQSAVDTLINVWSERLSRTYDQIESLALFAALPAVAAHVHATKPNGVILAAEFRDHLLEEIARIEGTDPRQPSPALRASVESLLRIMRVELGLLVESGPGAFRFSHQTFQEFLAAQHLVSDSGERAQRILSQLGDPRWREPILMAIALVNLQHPGQIVQLTSDLLVGDGPLGILFPESALLLAAAIPQMAMVPAEVLQPVVRRLLVSYSTLARQQRLPRVRGLIETAVAALRSGDYTAHVDEVLASVLTRPDGGDAALACTTAHLIQTLDVVSPRLAVALAEAAGAWDSADLGSPITQALTCLVSPAEIPEEGDPVPRLEPGWGSGMLPMRERLRRSPELVDRIRHSPQWLSLMLCLYGGYWHVGAAEALDEYQRMAVYLQLADEFRSPYEAYFGQRWGRDDPVYNMAVYLDTVGEKLKRKWMTAPPFNPESIARDSPFTWQVAQALSGDDLPGLIRFLRTRADGPDPAQREEALLALWALGHDIGPALAAMPASEGTAARRISALSSGLRDSTVQAGSQVAYSLTLLAGSLPVGGWERLFSAVQAVLIESGAGPASMLFSRRTAKGNAPVPIQSGAGPASVNTALSHMPRPERARVLGEELTQWIRGVGDDVVYSAAVFVDAVDAASYPPELVISAMNSRGTGPANDFHRYAHWWAADPLAFPYDGDPDIPLSILDQLFSVPPEMHFVPDWLFQLAITPIIERNPQLLPEVLVVAWAAGPTWHADSRDAVIDSLDSALRNDRDPVTYLISRCRAVTDPWHQARGLLRMAECFPDQAPEAVRAAQEATSRVADPARAFQLRERLARITAAPERAQHLAACHKLVGSITDPVTATIARLRLAAASPTAGCDALVLEAVEQVRTYSSPDAQLQMLHLILEAFPDCAGAWPASNEALTTLGFTSEECAWALNQWGRVIIPCLPELAETDPVAVQAWVPLALYALASDLTRAARRDESRAAWDRLASDPSPETVARVLAWYDSSLIDCTSAVARSLSGAIKALGEVPATVLRPLLGRLVRAGHDAEPVIRSWLEHQDPDVADVAALLLAEHRGLSAGLVPTVLRLLRANDDLSHSRARHLTGRGDGTLHTAVSRLGRVGVEQLAQFHSDQRVDSPGGAVAASWCLTGVVHDDPEALLTWCTELDANPDSASTMKSILGFIGGLTDPAWSVLLDRLRHGGATVQACLLRACAVMLHRSQRSQENSPDLQKAAIPFRISAQRWPQLWDVLRHIDPGPLRTSPVLAIDVEAVLDATAAALAATGGNLGKDSARRASQRLWEQVGSSIGEILAAGGEDAVRGALDRFGETQLARYGREVRAVNALDSHRAAAGRSEWPWMAILTEWTTELLSQSVRDEDLCWERSNVLEATASIAELNPDTFRRHADTETLTRLLTTAMRYHNSFPGRKGAAQLLGILRHGSAPVLEAFQEALLDTPDVRAASLDAISRLRNVDHTVIGDLIMTLSGRSTVAAWAAAQSLTIIGQNPSTPSLQRQRIIDALATAIQDPASRQPVFFAFTQAAIPEMPTLDDVFTEAIQKIYRFG